MTRLLDRLQAANMNPRGIQTWSQRVCEQIEAALAGQQTQIDAIVALNSDDILTPAKKPLWIFIYAFLTGEQAGLDAQATASGVTTEKTTYGTKVTALTTYLATLTTPVLWNNLSGNTTVVGVTLRTKFNDVMVAKQSLINKIADVNRVAAAGAQTTANTANTTANTANTTADAVKKTDKLSASWTSPGSVLSASDAGSNATITIAAHVRKYGDGTQLSVAGGSLTGKSYSTVYYVYYTDATLADTTPTYTATTDPNVAAYNTATGRHYVGAVTTPAAGAAGTTGGTTPPGGGYSGPAAIP